MALKWGPVEIIGDAIGDICEAQRDICETQMRSLGMF